MLSSLDSVTHTYSCMPVVSCHWPNYMQTWGEKKAEILKFSTGVYSARFYRKILQKYGGEINFTSIFLFPSILPFCNSLLFLYISLQDWRHNSKEMNVKMNERKKKTQGKYKKLYWLCVFQFCWDNGPFLFKPIFPSTFLLWKNRQNFFQQKCLPWRNTDTSLTRENTFCRQERHVTKTCSHLVTKSVSLLTPSFKCCLKVRLLS